MVTTHPADSPVEMTKLAREKKFAFPYLYDESQAVARAYDAACGSPQPVGKPAPQKQLPSIGCSIKWKAG